MKIFCVVGTTLAAVLGTAVVAAAGSSASVDCSGGTPGTFSSISAALASLPLDGPHLFSRVERDNGPPRPGAIR